MWSTCSFHHSTIIKDTLHEPPRPTYSIYSHCVQTKRQPVKVETTRVGLSIITIWNSCFLCEYIVKRSFWNHSNMIICSSKIFQIIINVENSFICFCKTLILLFYFINSKVKITAFLWYRHNCNTINVFLTI